MSPSLFAREEEIDTPHKPANLTVNKTQKIVYKIMTWVLVNKYAEEHPTIAKPLCIRRGLPCPFHKKFYVDAL
jgi:hypothetical protein